MLTVSYSCSEYLEKTEKADISSDDVFKDYNSFAGYIETMYVAIIHPHKAGNYSGNEFNYGDDTQNTYRDFSHNGNYMWGLTNNCEMATHLNEDLVWNASNRGYLQSYWTGWKAIRVANIALENLYRLENATSEQRQFIEGQCYFFRAWFHWELMRQWGAVPYVDKALYPETDMKIPVLTFNETAEKVVLDLEKAIERLPVDWDLTLTGSSTAGFNYGRITKGTAYGVMAEVLLFCGSPLMNGVSTGNYNYETDYMKRSAAAAWEVILLHRDSVYALEHWSTYSDMFYKDNAHQIPGGREIIMTPLVKHRGIQNCHYYVLSHLGRGSRYTSPNATYVEKFEMANGYPIDDPLSGHDPMNPWINRDPRFHFNMVLDNQRVVFNTNDARAFTQFYVGGRDKGSPNSHTGYGVQKYTNHRSTNSVDGFTQTYYLAVPRIRLAEVYLFYAEAVNEAYGPGDAHPGADLSAIGAVNVVRQRANMPDVHGKFTGSREAFRERIWNERAVELAFEGKRWYDLRRWYVAHLPEYKEIYALDFDKEKTYFIKRLLRIRNFEMKHYWMPFPPAQVSLYEGWKQNPGW